MSDLNKGCRNIRVKCNHSTKEDTWSTLDAERTDYCKLSCMGERWPQQMGKPTTVTTRRARRRIAKKEAEITWILMS